MLDFLKNIPRYFHTIRYLKPIQIYSRLFNRFNFQRKYDFKDIEVKRPKESMTEGIRKVSSMFDSNTFEFLNQKKQIQDQKDWNSDDVSKLWLYNLHYFDDLNSHNSEKKILWHQALIHRWIEDNPPSFGNGWEPYPTSLRIVNWIKYFLRHNHIDNDWLESLAKQTQHLYKNIEYGVCGNHLLANAKALIFSGLFFEGDHARIWLKKGQEILTSELSEQVLNDGGHFELSPMYHSIILEDLIDLYSLFDAYGLNEKKIVEGEIIKMFSWLRNMIHSDGEISFFNDSTFGIAPSLEKLTDFANSLNINMDAVNNNRLIVMKESGYSRIEMHDYVAIVDHGDTGPLYLGGHSHADTLSFELSLFEKRVIVNSGISIYAGMIPSNKTDPLRALQRSTSAHSTVNIDGENSSEVWGAFRLGRRAKVTEFLAYEENNEVRLFASHNGYRKILHQRAWNFKESSICIVDEILGRSSEKLTQLVLPIHPDVEIIEQKEKIIECEIKGEKFSIEFQSQGNLLIKDSAYFPEFGKSVDNIHIVFEIKAELPHKIKTLITW
jgi:uncharacterized heparinase superfamily protein